MNKISIQYYKTILGELILGVYDSKLCLCDWRYRKKRREVDTRIKEGLKAEFIEEETELGKATILQLEEYFNLQRKKFDIPLLLVGTDFQKQVWSQLLKIPFGNKESYLGLSKIMENEKAIRAIASANGANSISILIPCHRIVGSNGELVGYAGGLKAKEKLLNLESNNPATEQLSLFSN